MVLTMRKVFATIAFISTIGIVFCSAQDRIFLAAACIGEPYYESVSLVLEDRYTVSGSTVLVNSAEFVNVRGLPDGLRWSCSPCSATPGQEIRVEIEGTPTVDNSVDVYDLDVRGRVNINGGANFQIDFPYGVNSNYAIEVEDCNDEICYIPIDMETESTSCIDACDGSITAYPDRGVAPYSYSWHNGMTGRTITGLCSGGYFVTVTDATGCESTASVILSYLSEECEDACEMTLSFDTQDASCPEECDGAATALVENGTEPYIYDWGLGTGRQSTQSATELCPDTYEITVTDANQCQITSTVTVGTLETSCAPPPCEMTTQVNSDELLCATDCNAQARVIPSGGVAPYQFQWDAAAGNQNTATASNLCKGTYMVTTTDANGCKQIDTVQVQSSSELTINALLSVVEPGQCRRKGVVIVQGYNGQAPYSYQWSNGATANQLDSLPVGFPSVTVTDAAGCSVSQVFPNERKSKDDYCDLITFVRSNIETTRYTFQVPESLNLGQWTIEGGIIPDVIELGEALALTYTFAVEGTYTVCYTFVNSEGCEVQCCKDVRIEQSVQNCNLTTTQLPTQDAFEYSMPEVSEIAWLHADSVVLNPTLRLPEQTNCAPQQLFAVYLDDAGDYYRFCESEINLCAGANVHDEGFNFQNDQQEQVAQLANHPNPWSQQTTIRFDNPKSTNGQLEVLDMNGQRVFQQKLHLPKGQNSVPLRLALPIGIYIYRITTPEFSERAVMSVMR